MSARLKRLKPIHPEEILHQDFLRALNLSMNRRAITADTALRLSRYFNTSAHFWLNLQKDYELEIA